MKKNGLTAALTILSAAIYFGALEEASALPTFARQMSMPCSACHYEEFPVLKKFGQNFKASGFTMTGDQTKVEDENLSLPSVLNASIMLRMAGVKTNGTDAGFNTARSYAYDSAAGQAPGTELTTYLASHPNGFGSRQAFDSQKNKSTNAGEFQFPNDLAVFYGGRISENVGFILELGVINPASATNFRMPMMRDVGDFKIGFIPFYTDGIGPAVGFELLSTGAANNIVAGEHMMQFTAQQFIGTGIAATGGAFVLHHDLFYVNVSPYTPEGQGNHSSPSNVYSRLVFTPSIGDYEFGFGIQDFSGQRTVVNDPVDGMRAQRVLPKAQAIDAQMQGVIGIPIGIYISYARAPATETRWTLAPTVLPGGGKSPLDPGAGVIGGFDTAQLYTIPLTPDFNLIKAPGAQNTFNSQLRDKKAASITMTFSLLPNRLILLAAYMKGDNGAPANGQRSEFDFANITGPTGNVLLSNVKTSGQNKVQAVTLGIHYRIAQNIQLKIEQTQLSGSAYTKDGIKGLDTATAGPNSAGTGSFAYTNISGPWAPGGTGNRLTTVLIHSAF